MRLKVIDRAEIRGFSFAARNAEARAGNHPSDAAAARRHGENKEDDSETMKVQTCRVRICIATMATYPLYDARIGVEIWTGMCLRNLSRRRAVW